MARQDLASEHVDRPVRADARRNLQALLQAAMAVFATAGVNAPVRDIAERAGVGVGTIYRHFPKRADLIVAVFRSEVDSCADAATALEARHEPLAAMTAWLDRYIELIAAKRGLAAALHSGDPAYDGLPAYFERRLSPALGRLLRAAAASGAIRAGTEPRDLLWAIGSLCAPTAASDPSMARRMIALLLDGLLVGAAHCSSGRKNWSASSS